MDGALIQELISRCSMCEVVDKPPCIFRIYERYLPKDLRTLVVSESPPPGRKRDYIYNLSSRDRLRRVLSKVFGVNESEVINYLMSNGVFWSTAIKCRPLSKSHLKFMRSNCVYVLTEEIRVLKPRRIVALGRYAWESVNEALVKAGVPNVDVVKHYHPLYLSRFLRSELPRLKYLIIG